MGVYVYICKGTTVLRKPQVYIQNIYHLHVYAHVCTAIHRCLCNGDLMGILGWHVTVNPITPNLNP